MEVIIFIVAYLIIVNIIGFAVMGIDKARARKRAWRISEAQLFVIAIFGGSIGSIIGMYTFRHKTKHWYFVIGMPFILLVQILVVIALFLSPIEITIF